MTRPHYGAAYKEFFLRSDNKVFQKLGELLHIGPSVLEGLQQALNHKWVATIKTLYAKIDLSNIVVKGSVTYLGILHAISLLGETRDQIHIHKLPYKRDYL